MLVFYTAMPSYLASRPLGNRMNSRLFALAALFAGLAVVTGAFGAHALKATLTPNMLSVWHTAVNYQMWHGLGLGLIALYSRPSAAWHWSARLMIAGIVLFSGSLYLLVLTGFGWLGMITPLGGLAFIAAWGLLAYSAWRDHDS